MKCVLDVELMCSVEYFDTCVFVEHRHMCSVLMCSVEYFDTRVFVEHRHMCSVLLRGNRRTHVS